MRIPAGLLSAEPQLRPGEGILTWSETIPVTPEIMKQGLKKKIQLTAEAPDGENGTKTVEWTVTITTI